MNPKLSKFSVIIPCRNAGDWIQNSLSSVLSQTLEPNEIIVIDDGSTDGSVEQILAFGDSVRLLHSEHRNGAGTRNVGITAATSDWIAFLDADDVWYPDHLQRANDLLQGSTDVGFLNWFDHFSNESPDQLQSRPSRLDISSATSGLSDLRFFENYHRLHWFNMHGCVVRRERLLEVGMLDPTQKRRHDIEMWIRVVHGHTWSYDPVPSSAYRLDSPGSISRNVANASYYLHLAIKKNIERLPKDIGKSLLVQSSKSALINAIANGSSEDIERNFDEAHSSLPFFHRWLFSVAKLSPSIVRQVVQLKRRLSC